MAQRTGSDGLDQWNQRIVDQEDRRHTDPSDYKRHKGTLYTSVILSKCPVCEILFRYSVQLELYGMPFKLQR